MSGLHEQFDELAAGVPVYGDLDRAIARARLEQRRRTRALTALTAAAAVIAVVVSVIAVNGGGPKALPPVGPATTPGPTQTPSVSAWKPTGPLRADATRVVSTETDQFGNPQAWADPRDTTSPGIDIVAVYEGQDFNGGSSWRFQLAARTARDPVGRVIAYGVVVDGDGDHRPDCQVGVSNDGPEEGQFHVWVTNLRTHVTAVQDGPPYGMPVEFAHPAEDGMPSPPEIQLGFLSGLTHPDPCERFGAAPTFYAWSSVTKAAEIVETDYAPDAAWLPIDCAACKRP